jgi:hypothetical protein
MTKERTTSSKYSEAQKASARETWHKNKHIYNERAKLKLEADPDKRRKKLDQVNSRNKYMSALKRDAKHGLMSLRYGDSNRSLVGNSATNDEIQRASTTLVHMKNSAKGGKSYTKKRFSRRNKSRRQK